MPVCIFATLASEGMHEALDQSKEVANGGQGLLWKDLESRCYIKQEKRRDLTYMFLALLTKTRGSAGSRWSYDSPKHVEAL